MKGRYEMTLNMLFTIYLGFALGISDIHAIEWQFWVIFLPTVLVIWFKEWQINQGRVFYQVK